MPYLEVNDTNGAASRTLVAVCQRLNAVDQELSEMRSDMTNYNADQKEAMAAMTVEIAGEVIHYTTA